ncbi:MAG: hypothetical protein KDA84_09870 [Planctomycetaceae bacterium]|nr:hypothetical protein [Planctomycetaceae bacterium]
MFEDLYPVTTVLEPVPREEVDRLAKDYDIELPLGYREFLEQYGPGVVCDFLEIYSPEKARTMHHTMSSLLCSDLFDGNREFWTQLNVTFEQFIRAFCVISTDQTGYYLSIPEHGSVAFEVWGGSVVAHPTGLPGIILAVSKSFAMEFPYFEPTKPQWSFASHFLRPGLDFEEFLASIHTHWGSGVRRLHSEEDDYAVTVFSRPVQGKFVCYRESGLHQPEPFSFQVNVFCDEEHVPTINDFLAGFER